MKITDKEIKRICSDTVYKQGSEYYKEGRVHIKQRKDSSLVAVVDGDRLYNVHIAFSDDKITQTFCTCPYYQTMNAPCKHIVATLKVRQAEMENVISDGNENDFLSAKLCREFSKKAPEQIGIALSLSVNSSPSQKAYSASFFLVGKNGKLTLPSIEGFLDAYVSHQDYKVTKAKSIRPSDMCFEETSGEIINILAEVYENKKCANQFQTPEVYRISFGEESAKRLFEKLENFPSEYIIDSVSYKNIGVVRDNPDIMIDITALDKNICLSLSENPIALTRGGEVFFFDNKIYLTDKVWRSWFMPIYNNMIAKNRTRLEFSGEQGIDFVANVLPHIRNKQGVTCFGVDELVVMEEPEFFIYFDEDNEKIRAKAEARYGSLSLFFPQTVASFDKILIRCEEKENDILSHFKGFKASDGYFVLENDEEIFKFLSRELPVLEKKCEIIGNETFEGLLAEELPEIKAFIDYNEKIDLLEFNIKSELSRNEILKILESYWNNDAYIKLSDGRYYDFSKENEFLDLLSNLPTSVASGKERHLSKFYALYLACKADDKLLEASDEFWRLIKSGINKKVNIPDGLKKVLRDYQRVGVEWLFELSNLGLGGILADEMGLGKTLEVISFVMSKQRKLPALVVAPSSLLYNWYEEILRFAPDAKVKIADGVKEEREKDLKKIKGYDFVITSYALLRRDIEEYEKLEFSYCFIDEAQNIKNARTMSARAVKRVRAGGYFAITGTPIENNLSELWSIFDFILPGYLSSEKSFYKKYQKPGEAGDFKRLKELRKKIKPFILRRVKKDVLSELPEKIENNIFAEFSPEQKNIYEAFLTLARNEVKGMREGNDSTVKILSLLTRLRQICCHPALIKADYKKESGKLNLLLDTVLSAISSGHRVLIFSQFTSMLSIIEKALKKEGIDTFYLDGATPNIDRVSFANRFNSGEKKVFLVSLKAGGTGLNLVGADTVIHYDPWWNPAVTDQATDRAHRIGQTRSVQVIKLITKDSIEERILKLSEKKRGLADGIIRENKNLLSSLSKKELLELFS